MVQYDGKLRIYFHRSQAEDYVEVYYSEDRSIVYGVRNIVSVLKRKGYIKEDMDETNL